MSFWSLVTAGSLGCPLVLSVVGRLVAAASVVTLEFRNVHGGVGVLDVVDEAVEEGAFVVASVDIGEPSTHGNFDSDC